jgi:hypothetical protein
MVTKTVNVSEETKKYLDAAVDAMCCTQDKVVAMALSKLCPVKGWNTMSLEKLTLIIAKQQVRRLRFMQDVALCDEHGLALSDLGTYPSEVDGCRDYDEYCRQMNQLDEDGTYVTVKNEEESS